MPINRPNFVLFMPEQLRADAVFGPSETRALTPNMDRLAEEGVAFTNCFAQTALCTPSRCSMFTGRYPHTLGHRSLPALLQPEERNFFRDLKDAGYRNVAFGKNDLLAQQAIPLCFDEAGCRVATEPDCDYEPLPHPDGSRWGPTFYFGRRTHEDCHDADWARVQSAFQFLDESHDRPFCLYLPLTFAHPPYKVEEPFFSMHRLEDIPDPIPAELSGKRTYMRELHKAYGLDKLSTDDLKEIKRVYFGMISRVDHQLGQLIDKLKQRGFYENTILVVLSDHGDFTGDFGMGGKYLAGFEDCLLRVPLTLRGPGIGLREAQTCLCEMTDLYPTLLELAGLQSEHYHFGRSLCPRMRGESEAHRDAVFAEAGRHIDEAERFHHIVEENSLYWPMYQLMLGNERMARRAMMVRTKKWKYVYSPYDRDELFEVGTDPREIVNLADEPQYADVVAQLRERLLRWMLDTSDVLPPVRDPRGWKP